MDVVEPRSPTPERRNPHASGGAVLLFDGVCNLCNAAVTFVIDRDPKVHFRFASLQSEVARSLLKRHGVPDRGLESLVLLEDGQMFTRSTAALRVARRLSGPWPVLYLATVIPAPLRDRVYDWVAAHRYRWFGRAEACRLPTPEVERRFLEP